MKRKTKVRVQNRSEVESETAGRQKLLNIKTKNSLLKNHCEAN